MIHNFNVIPTKIQNPNDFLFCFSEIQKPIQKFMWNLKERWIAKIILQKKKKVGLTLPDVKTYHKVMWYTNETVCSWDKDRHKEKWVRAESPEINPCLCIQWER